MLKAIFRDRFHILKVVCRHKLQILIVVAVFAGCLAFEWYMIHCKNEQYWIELFNGATFPTKFDNPSHIDSSGWWFYVVLALRTLLNVSGVMTVALGFIVLVRTERLMNKYENGMKRRDTALTGYLLKELAERNVEISPETRDALFKASDAFAGTFASKTMAQRFLAKDGARR